MKALSIFLAMIFQTTILHCQNKTELSIFGGRVLFGTGDVPGYGINIALSKNIIKKPKAFLAKLMIGGELSFENGVIDPKVINPTFLEFLSKTFYHASNSVATIKLTYFPIPKTFLRGISIAIGPSIGYTYQSTEREAAYRYDSVSAQSVRRSYLAYYNAVIVGYRISVGYMYYFKKNLHTGIRLDFSNYNNGDINTLAGLEIGYSFK
jgi:hypothetical protein